MGIQKICQKKCLAWVIFLVLIGSNLSAHSPEDSFRKLSLREKRTLGYFFDTAIKRDHLGHVLFFSTKPACMSVINTNEKEQALFAQGWDIWKSKENLFQHPNFIIYDEKCEDRIYIYFINKKTLFAQLAPQEKCLKELFGDSFSIKELVEKLEQKKFQPLINKDHVLLGILLGYGLESSLQYKQYITLDQQDLQQDLTGILCAADELVETIQVDNVTFCQLKSKTEIHPVTFIGNSNSEEVKRLKEIYSKELIKIDGIYSSKDLLRICLKKICD